MTWQRRSPKVSVCQTQPVRRGPWHLTFWQVVPHVGRPGGGLKFNLSYAIRLPGRKSAFRVEFWPECYVETTEIGPPAHFRFFPGGSPAKIWPGMLISGPEALLRNIEYHVYFYLFAVGPKSSSTHDLDFELVSGAAVWCNLHYFSSRGRSRSSRGPPWAPRGRNSAENLGPNLSFDPPQGLPWSCAVKRSKNLVHHRRTPLTTREAQDPNISASPT